MGVHSLVVILIFCSLNFTPCLSEVDEEVEKDEHLLPVLSRTFRSLGKHKNPQSAFDEISITHHIKKSKKIPKAEFDESFEALEKHHKHGTRHHLEPASPTQSSSIDPVRLRRDVNVKDENVKSETEGEKEKKSIMGGLMGTMFSGANAAGQTLENWAGPTGYIGSFGRSISRTAESWAGKIKFVLYTPTNPKVGMPIEIANISQTPWMKGKPVIAIIHGFTPAGYYENNYDNLVSSFKIKDGLLTKGIEANIIVVDWTSLSSDGTYVFSSTSTATTADRLSSLLTNLIQKGYITGGSAIRIIGHSLGGHTAGITGLKFQEKMNNKTKIHRIDAIDPAGPNFDTSNSEYQLGPNQADFVHVMHCNIKMLGSHFNRGTIDFYPNGGDDLPGCEPDEEVVEIKRRKRFSILPFDTTKAYNSISSTLSAVASAKTNICNHCRCIDLYIETIDREMTGCQCPSWEEYLAGKCTCTTPDKQARMGYQCPETAKGVYYMNVTMTSKYEVMPANRSDYNNYGAGGDPERLDPLKVSVSSVGSVLGDVAGMPMPPMASGWSTTSLASQMSPMPTLAGMPKMPPMPTLAGMPKMPPMPSLAGMPKMPPMPTLAGMPPMPTMKGMPKLPPGLPLPTGGLPSLPSPVGGSLLGGLLG